MSLVTFFPLLKFTLKRNELFPWIQVRSNLFYILCYVLISNLSVKNNTTKEISLQLFI